MFIFWILDFNFLKNKKNFITSELTDKNDYKKYILKVKNISLRRIIFVQVHYCATVILSIPYLVSTRWILFKKKLMNKRFIVLRLCFLLISITIITNLATIYFFDIIISITFKKRSMKYFCINYTHNKSYAKIDIIIRKIFNKMQK